MRWFDWPVVAGAMIMLASCGGGGSSSGGGTTSAAPVTTTPTPPVVTTPVAPAPATPAPAPTVRAYAVGKGPAFFRFYTNEIAVFPTEVVSGYGDRDGLYYPGFASQLLAYTSSTDAAVSPTTDVTARSKDADFVDQISSLPLQLNAPAAARVVTPLTTMMRAQPDQTILKTQLGVTGTAFPALSANPDILSYDAVSGLASGDATVRRDAARMIAHHLRAIAVGLAADTANGGIDVYGNKPWFDGLATYFRIAPNRFLINDADMAAMVKNYTDFHARAIRSDVLAAAGHLIVAYTRAIPDEVSSEDEIARYMLGAHGYLVQELAALLRENSAEAAVRVAAINSVAVDAATVRYREHLTLPATGLVFPMPDFYTMTAGSELALVSQPVSGAPTYNDRNLYPGFNDRHAKADNNGIQLISFPPVRSVSVPSANSGQIAVTRNSDFAITIRALGSFRGVTYFDYVAGFDGAQATGRAYVVVK